MQGRHIFATDDTRQPHAASKNAIDWNMQLSNGSADSERAFSLDPYTFACFWVRTASLALSTGRCIATFSMSSVGKRWTMFLWARHQHHRDVVLSMASKTSLASQVNPVVKFDRHSNNGIVVQLLYLVQSEEVEATR